MSRYLLSIRVAVGLHCLSLRPVITTNFVGFPLSASCPLLAANNKLSCGTSVINKRKHSSSAACDADNIQNPSTMNEAEWKKRLTPQQFAVCRLSETEPPFSGEFTDHTAPGTYACIACAAPLFSSASKFKSGCGWPAFSASIGSSVEHHPDTSHGMNRVEVKCSKCKSHLGHVFDDGPPPTGQRYCINSVCLRFLPKDGGQT